MHRVSQLTKDFHNLLPFDLHSKALQLNIQVGKLRLPILGHLGVRPDLLDPKLFREGLPKRLSPPSFFFFFFLSFLFRLLCILWSSKARDQIWGAVMTYTTAVAIPDPLTHCTKLGIQTASWCYRDATDPIAPQWELQDLLNRTTSTRDLDTGAKKT